MMEFLSNMAASIHNTGVVLEPPYCRLKIVIDDAMKEKLGILKSSLSSLLKSEHLHKMLTAESRLLHVSIYKRSAQLRIDKSLQLLKRVKACLQRLSIVGRLFSLGEDVNADICRTFSAQENVTFSPSQQVWTFMLHIVSNYFNLLNKTIDYSKSAFEFLSCQLSTGMLIPTMILFMGIMARIWQISRSLQVKLAAFYKMVYTAHLEMKPTVSQWLYPSLPTELSSPSLQSAHPDKEWSSTITSFSETKNLVCTEQQMKMEGTTDDVAVSCISAGLDNDGSEDLGVIVSHNKRKRKRYDDRAFLSKKRNIQSNISLPLERLNDTAVVYTANTDNFENHNSILQKKKKKKRSVQQESTSRDYVNKADTSHQADYLEKVLEKKSKNMKKKCTSAVPRDIYHKKKSEVMTISKTFLDTSLSRNQSDDHNKISKKKKKKKLAGTLLEKMPDGNILGGETSPTNKNIEMRLSKKEKKKMKKGFNTEKLKALKAERKELKKTKDTAEKADKKKGNVKKVSPNSHPDMKTKKGKKRKKA